MCQAHEISFPNHFALKTKSQNLLLHNKIAGGIQGNGFGVVEKFSFSTSKIFVTHCFVT